jgi:uncharacterized protein (DUF488 family)
MPRIATIGAYGWTEEAFFAALTGAGVDVFCDVRARRGVRGPVYAFANSERLQARLADLGIRYIHRKDLAPDAETRALQSAADRAGRILKRDRRTLTPAFNERYRRERLDGFDPAAFLADLGPDASTIALFCVEGYPEACHRSLLADRIASVTGAGVTHLLPH